MLYPVEDPSEVQAAIARAAAIVADGFVRQEWLHERGFVALPEESGGHLTTEQCSRLGHLLAERGEPFETAVITEPLTNHSLVYELQASPEDLAALSWECGAFNCLLLPKIGTAYAVFFSTADYLLVAGAESFVSSYVHDLAQAREDFCRFIDTHFEFMRPTLQKVAHYFDWVPKVDGASDAT